MKVYRQDIWVCATIYVRAESKGQAKRIIAQQKHKALEVPSGRAADMEISELMLNDPELPKVSLSPMMTVHGPTGSLDDTDEWDVGPPDRKGV